MRQENEHKIYGWPLVYWGKNREAQTHKISVKGAVKYE